MKIELAETSSAHTPEESNTPGVRALLKPYLCSSVFICGFIAFATIVQAQPFPSKPIRFILSYPPGGATDTLGRIVAKSLSDAPPGG